ncbi:helix-turn-helix domain-containing protein [Clostridium paraputrificum]|uniref:helix-turn-helix domain-containing protein n=1 Tax=Clostridium paraputrificum TaxID=29363 RepID=UPI00189F1BA7|nr:helix-turn-helix transcriptional regulator [Clostridium paraputrificum]MDB2116487.1 helix-turn-helix transcriptional regulator [Clostridium paraputrificum]
MENERVGKYINLKRKALRMTQQELADKLGVTNKAVSKWERGEGYPEVTLLTKLAYVLNVTVDELLKGEDSKESKVVANDSGIKDIKILLLKSIFISIILVCTTFLMLRVQTFFIRVQILTLVTVICCILNIAIIIVNLEKRNISIKEDKTIENRISILIWIWSGIIFGGIFILSLQVDINNTFISNYRREILLILGIIASLLGTIKIKRK